MSEFSPTPIELTPPEPSRRVTPEEAEGLIRLKAETLSDLDQRVEHFLGAILSEPLGSEAFTSRLDGVHRLAHEDIQAAAQISNRLLEQPARSLRGGLMDETSTVSRSLMELRKTLEDLDPSRQGDLLAPKRLLGFIPMGNRLQDYFLRFESAQSHLDAILKSLYDGQDELRKDNAAIEEEKSKRGALWSGWNSTSTSVDALTPRLKRSLEKWIARTPKKPVLFGKNSFSMSGKRSRTF